MDNYYTKEQNHYKFLKEFYDLPLHRKLPIVTPLLAGASWLTLERIVLALIQHSSKELKTNYPVQKERKLSKIAQLADEEYKKSLIYQKEDTIDKSTN